MLLAGILTDKQSPVLPFWDNAMIAIICTDVTDTQ